MKNIYKFVLLLSVSAFVFVSCNNQKSVDPIAVINLITGTSTTGSPSGINFTTVNDITSSTNTQFAFRLNVVAPKSFQSLSITKQIYTESSGSMSTPQLIYLGVSGYDAAPFIRNQVLGGTLSTTTSFQGFSRYPNSIPLIETGVQFSSSYLTTSSGFVLQTGFSTGVIEKYKFTVVDNYGREGSNYLNISIPSTGGPI